MRAAIDPDFLWTEEIKAGRAEWRGVEFKAPTEALGFWSAASFRPEKKLKRAQRSREGGIYA